MRFIFRWLKRLLIAVSAGCVLILLLQATALPAIVQHAIVTQLERLGITVQDLAVRHVSWHHMILSDVALKFGETLRIESVRIEYDFASIRAGRVSSINVTGATLEVDFSDRQIDFTPQLQPERRNAGIRIPFDEIALGSSRLRVRHDGTITDTPIEGTVRLQTDRSLRFNLVGGGFSGSLSLTGSVDSDGEVDVDIEFDNVDLRSVRALLPDSAGQLSSAHGDGSLSLHYSGMDRRIEAEGGFSTGLTDQDGVPLLGTEGVELSIDCTFDNTWCVSTLDLDLAAKHLMVGGHELRDTRITGRKEADLLLFTLNSNHEIWQFESSHGTLSGLFPRTNQAKSLQGAIYDSSPRNLNATVILNGIDGTIGSIRVRTESAEVSGRLSREKDGLTWVDASFRIPDVSIGTEALTVVASGVNGSSTLRFDATPTGSGTFEVQSLTLDDYALPGISGSVSVETNRLDGTAQWPVLGEEAIVAHATLDRTPRLDAETLRVRVPSFNVERGSRLNAWIEDRIGWNVTGRIGLEGSLPPDSQHAERGMRILVEDAALSKAAIAVEGLTGAMVLRDFNPVSTGGNQRFHIRSIESGKLRLDDGLLLFRLEGPDSVFVEQTRWQWAGGFLSSLAFRFHPSDPILNMNLFAENLDVSDILHLIFGDRATGSGHLYGRLPLRVRWRPQPGISFGAGYLYAAPGAGTFNLYDREVLDNALATGLPGARGDRKSRAFRDGIAEALQDFEYSSFGITFSEHPQGRPAGTIHVEGEGRGPTKLPLRLTINFAEEQL